MMVVQRKANVELPEDVVRLGFSPFKETERDTTLAKLRLEIGTGEPASPRLLRCLLINSRGDLKLPDH